MKATININTPKGIKTITKNFKSDWDAREWIVKFKSDRYFGFTGDGTFACVYGFDFSQLIIGESAEPID